MTGRRKIDVDFEDPADGPGPEDRGDWRTILEPEGWDSEVDAERNEGGLAIFITDGHRKQKVTRVAFVRRNSRNPDDDFRAKVHEYMAVAKAACEELNESIDAIVATVEEDPIS